MVLNLSFRPSLCYSVDCPWSCLLFIACLEFTSRITGCKPAHVLLFILSLFLFIHSILVVKGLLPASRYSRYGGGQQHPWNQKVRLMETRSYSHMVRGVTTRTWSSEGQTLNSAPRGWRRPPRRNGTCTVLWRTCFLELTGNHHCPSTLDVGA